MDEGFKHFYKRTIPQILIAKMKLVKVSEAFDIGN